MRKKPFFLFCLILALTLPLTACARNGGAAQTDGTDEPHDAETEVSVSTEPQSLRTGSEGEMELADGLMIEEVFSYSGAYVEDGGNAVCENICAVRLYNGSPTHYRYLRFALDIDGGRYTFAASTLFSGARMTVLCEEKLPAEGTEILSSEILSSVPFEEPPTVHTDTLEITYADGFINVKNLTDAALSNVYVYFKDTDDYGYLGGITYRTSFGEIPPGETVQSGASNMRRATCRVVFATYDP